MALTDWPVPFVPLWSCTMSAPAAVLTTPGGRACRAGPWTSHRAVGLAARYLWKELWTLKEDRLHPGAKMISLVIAALRPKRWLRSAVGSHGGFVFWRQGREGGLIVMPQTPTDRQQPPLEVHKGKTVWLYERWDETAVGVQKTYNVCVFCFSWVVSWFTCSPSCV